MAKTLNTNATEIKTDLICMVQMNYEKRKAERILTEEKAKREEELARELEERKTNASRYSARVERRRNIKRNMKLNICKGIAVVGVVSVTMITCVVAFAKSEPRYAIANNNGNGIHYQYVTERECVVTEVTDTQVYVAYKGNEYSFYAYETELEVNDEIICQFTDNWEIVGVVE